MFKHKFSILFFAIMLVAIFCLYSLANASALMGKRETCFPLASFAYNVAQIRDAGQSFGEVLKDVSEGLDEALKNPDSFIKDQTDVAMVKGLVKAIFDSKETAEQLANGIYEACMAGTSSITKQGFRGKMA